MSSYFSKYVSKQFLKEIIIVVPDAIVSPELIIIKIHHLPNPSNLITSATRFTIPKAINPTLTTKNFCEIDAGEMVVFSRYSNFIFFFMKTFTFNIRLNWSNCQKVRFFDLLLNIYNYYWLIFNSLLLSVDFMQGISPGYHLCIFGGRNSGGSC